MTTTLPTMTRVDRAVQLVLATLIVVYTLTVTTSTHLSTDAKNPIAHCVITILGFVAIVHRLSYGSSAPRSDSRWLRLALAPVILIVIAAISWRRSPYTDASQAAFIDVATMVAFYFIVALYARHRRIFLTLCNAILLGAAGAAVYAVLQTMGIHLHHGATSVTSTFGNSNLFAGFVVFALPVAIGVASTDKGPWARLWWFIAALLLYCLAIAQTRGAWLAAGLQLVIGIAWWRWGHSANHRTSMTVRHQRRYVLAVVTIALLSLPVVLPRVQQTITNFREFDSPESAGVQNSIHARLLIWEGTIRLIKEAPALGHGIGTFMIHFPRFRPPALHTSGHGHTTHHAHCEYLEQWAEVGFVGLAVFVWIVVYSLAQGARAARLPDDSITTIVTALIIGIVGQLAYSAVTVDFRFTSAFYCWLTLGLLAAANMAHEPSDGRRRPSLKRRRRPQLAAVTALVGCGACTIALPHLWRPLTASQALKNGTLAESAGDTANAKHHYSHAVALKKNNYPALYKWGFLLTSERDFSTALNVYTALTAVAPHYSQVNHQLGVVHRQLGSLEEAVSQLDIACRYHPYYADSHRELGLTLLELGRTNDAEHYLKRARTLAPFDPAVTDGLVSVYFSQQRWQDAIACSKSLIEAGNAVPATYSNLGCVYASIGQSEQAHTYLAKAVMLDPMFLAGYRNLLVFLESEKRLNEAKRIRAKIRQLEATRESIGP